MKIVKICSICKKPIKYKNGFLQYFDVNSKLKICVKCMENIGKYSDLLKTYRNKK